MKKNYSYVTLLTNDSYAYGVVLLAETLKSTKSKYPLLCIVNEEVSEATKEMIRQCGASILFQPTIPTPAPIYEHNIAKAPGTAQTWRNCWTKFKIFDLVDYDKIVFLDADVLVLKNLDHLFDKPHMTSCLDGEYFNIWPGWDHFNSGCLVIEPSHDKFEDIMRYANSLQVENLPNYAVADQEVLNLYFDDWPQHPELNLGKYYDVFPPYIQEDQDDDISENAYFLHFVGRKPWTFWVHNPKEHYSEKSYTLGKEIIDNALKKLDWEAIRSKLVLTVYAICKNEVNNIEKFMASYGEADHVVILDTGSDDGSYEKLQEMQKVYPNLIVDQRTIKPWRFDTARNESMKLIPDDTSIWFMNDLDEVIKEKGWSKLVKDVWTPMFDRGSYTYNREVDENDCVTKQIPEYRIHSREWCRWDNVVHEALVNYHGNKQFWIETCTPVAITVWHYPRKDKKTDYLELCEQDLESNPNDWIMQLQLAIEYEIRNELQKALNKFLFIIGQPNTLQAFELARCYYGAGRLIYEGGNKTLGLNYLRLARMADPQSVDAYIFEASEYIKAQNYIPAIELLKNALSICTGAKWCSITDVNSALPYYLLGVAYANLNMKGNAIACLSVALVRSEDQEIRDLYNTLSRSFESKDLYYMS